MNYIIVNGEIINKKEAGFTSFFWDEPFVITQKIWFGFGGIPLFRENIEEIITILKKLNTEIPELLNDESELFRITKRMLNKNRYYRSGIITCRLYIGQTEINTIISSIAFQEFDFPISNQGLFINFSEFEKYSVNPLNQFALLNVPHWEFTKARNFETTIDNSVFVNEKQAVCDCIAGNIFMVKGRVLYTPSAGTGCYIDTLRNFVLDCAKKANLKVMESDGIRKEEIFQMEEVFLAGEEQGIQLVLGLDNKRFVHNNSRKIHEYLNEFLKKNVAV